MATLNSYKELIQNEVDDFSARGGNVIEQAIKDTYQEILRYTGKSLIGTLQEQKTVDTATRYITPSDFISIEDVQYHNAGDTEFVRLKQISEEDYLQRCVNLDAGRPYGWYVNGLRIYFDRIPDTLGTALITFVPVQQELSGNVVSIIPDRFTNVILYGVLARFKAYERLPDATEYQNRYAGPFLNQGRIEGALGAMLEELRTKGCVLKPKLYNR
jgi:hypothetical protein